MTNTNGLWGDMRTAGPSSESHEIAIREMTPDDYPAVIRLWSDAGLPFRPEGRDHPDKMRIELERGTAVFLVADEDGVLVGVVLGTHDGRKGWINRLAVAPAYQRRGIAGRLVSELETRFEALGLEIVAALIESHNEVSLEFFRAIGYLHDPEIEYLSKRRSAET